MNDQKTISDIVKFNIGGTLFSTYKSTISKCIRKISPRSEYYNPNMLQKLANDPNCKLDENKAIFIDRNPQYFNCILDFFRLTNYDENGNLNTDEFKERLPKNEEGIRGLIKDAEFYQIDYLVELLKTHLKNPFFDSLILTPSQARCLIKLCEFPADAHWKLIFRGTRDGFHADNFHEKCDDVTGTLVIGRSVDGYIFGAYTDQLWTQKGECKKDKNAFIFSLVNKENMPLKMPCEEDAFATCCYKGYGPCFGGGHDLSIASNCNQNSKSYANLGCSYKHPKYKYCTEEAQNFIAGTYRFKINELEVYTKI